MKRGQHRFWHWWLGRLAWQRVRGDVETGVFTVKDASHFICRFCGCFMGYDEADEGTALRLAEAIRDA